jgi:hypothetical protein
MILQVEIDMDRVPEGAGASGIHIALYAPLLRVCNDGKESYPIEVAGVRVGQIQSQMSVKEMIDESRSRGERLNGV